MDNAHFARTVNQRKHLTSWLPWNHPRAHYYPWQHWLMDWLSGWMNIWHAGWHKWLSDCMFKGIIRMGKQLIMNSLLKKYMWLCQSEYMGEKWEHEVCCEWGKKDWKRERKSKVTCSMSFVSEQGSPSTQSAPRPATAASPVTLFGSTCSTLPHQNEPNVSPSVNRL